MRPITLIFALAATLHLLTGTALAAGWTWPVRGPVLTAYRNSDDPYLAGQHRGIDIGAPAGSRVVAAVGGTVTFVGVVGSSGLTVSERSADGRFDLSYLHLSAASVRRGESVAEGAAVGAVGTSGRRSAEAPHLHFGVREADSRSAYRDPLDFLPPPPPGNAPEPAPVPVPAAHPADPEPAVAEPSPVAALATSSVPGPAPLPSAAPLPGLPLSAAVPAPHHSVVTTEPAPHPATTAVAGHRELPRLATGEVPARLARTAVGPRASEHDHSVGTPKPSVGPSSEHAARPARGTGSPAAHPGAGSHHAGTGIDLGWLAACISLIAVATALGHPDGARRTVARGRAGLAALLRPASRGGSAQ